MRRLPRRGLVLRALWWRRGLTAAVLGVAVVTTTAAALGPLYARAAGESILQDHLTAAGAKAGLHLHADIHISRKSFAHTAAQTPRPGAELGYEHQIRGLYTQLGEFASAPKHNAVQTALVWRSGACAQVVLVSGRCPRAAGEAIASQDSVDSPRRYGWKLGVRLRLEPDLPPQFTPPPSPHPVRIVGVYRPKDPADPFWFGQPYFVTGVGGGQQDTPDLTAALFVAQSTFFSLSPRTVVEADFDYPLTPSAIRLDSVGTARTAATRLVHRYPGTGKAGNYFEIPTTTLAARTGLRQVLASAAHERHLAEVGTLLVTVQLALLAWLVLFQIISDAIEARGNEIAMAKLRGLSPAATVRFGLGEPVVLLAAAVPLGLAAALGVTRLFAASALVSGVPVVLPLGAVGTALIAFAGGLVAAALAGYRTLTRSVLDQWRRTNRAPGSGRLALAADVLIAGAAVAGLFLLRAVHGTASSGNTASLLAPGLLVAAVGILGVRLLPLVSKWLASRTRGSRRLGVFLAARQVARRPVGLRLAALLAVAVGLATFAVSGETVATTNRSARAQGEIGAPRVASVQFDPGVDPVAATAQADPDGAWAMAAATWLPDGGDSVTGTVLGVDASRLPAVGRAAAGGPSVAEIARAVGAAPVPPITTTTSRLRVHLHASGLTGNRRPYLTLDLQKPQDHFYSVDSGTITDGRHTYTVPVRCASRCTLHGMLWNRSIDATVPERGTVTLTGIDVRRGNRWHALDLGLRTPDAWRAAVPAGQATDHVTVTSTGVEDSFTNENGGYGGITYNFPPSPIPAVATAKATTHGPDAPDRPQVLDYSQTTAYFHVVGGFVPVLPAVLDDGVVMDVRFLDAELPSFRTEARWQVWLGDRAPRDALARLDRAGLHVEHVRSESTRVHQLGRQGPALALLLLLVCAVAGAVLAVGGTAISISASSRRRSYEIAALRAVGVQRGALRRASVVEQLLLLGGAAVLGIPTGLVAARLAMPVIPEFADRTPVALRYTPHWIPPLLFAAAFLVLLAATAVVAAYALIRVAVPARLRETET